MFHFLPILERILNFKCLVLLHLLNNMFKIHGFRNTSPKFHGFRGTHGTHANAATVKLKAFGKLVKNLGVHKPYANSSAYISMITV